jgi:DNA-binding beta-propeller fold protein YncE
MRNKNKICGLTIAALASTVTALAADHVTGSPNQQSEIDLLSMPSDIAIGKDSQSYIVDSGNHQVTIYDATGLMILSLGSMGSEDGQLMSPLGIGLSAKGEVYVADKGNNRIVMFDSKGRARSHFEIEADGEGVVPVDIAVGPKGKELFITDNASHRVVVVNAKGEFQRAWGGEGEDDGQFRYPATIDIDAAGNVYVVDVLNARVQKFDAAGTHLLTVGELGGKPGNFYRPKGVAVDDAGTIYVSDSFLGVVQVFNAAGEFQYVLGEEGVATVYDTPVGMAASGNRLYVTQMLAGKVAVLEPQAPPPPEPAPAEEAAE